MGWYDSPNKLVALLRMPHSSSTTLEVQLEEGGGDARVGRMVETLVQDDSQYIYILSVLVPQSDDHGSLVEQGLSLISLSSLRLSRSLSSLSHLSLLHTSHILSALKVSSLLCVSVRTGCKKMTLLHLRSQMGCKGRRERDRGISRGSSLYTFAMYRKS